MSSTGQVSLAVPLQADVPYASLPVSAQLAPHPLAYLPGLPQTPLLMVYSGHMPDAVTQREGHLMKRERQEEEDDDQAAKRSKRSASIESEMVGVMSQIKTVCIYVF